MVRSPGLHTTPSTRAVIVNSADLDADDEVLRAYNRMRAALDDRVRFGEQTLTASAAGWPTHHPNAPLAGVQSRRAAAVAIEQRCLR